ncbi:MAG: hypothetical protein NTW75_03185 [Planctomycetales bacterium]|jgi:hypothetical protein|nr:hypothetical protein [Planctomycetales bacterium]
MKMTVVWCGVVLSHLWITTVSAFPPIPAQIKETLKDNKVYQPFLDTLDGLTSKCDVCHKPGADKKGKGHGLNDFGKVFHDRFEAKNYKKSQDEKKTSEALKLFQAAWDKSVIERTSDGKVYGDLMKSGLLPSKNE